MHSAPHWLTTHANMLSAAIAGSALPKQATAQLRSGLLPHLLARQSSPPWHCGITEQVLIDSAQFVRPHSLHSLDVEVRVQADVSKRQVLGLHPRLPALKPSCVQSRPARSIPSQASPRSATPLPHTNVFCAQPLVSYRHTRESQASVPWP